MNILAVKLGEHPDVRLPVIVAYDGFFTSHQKRLVHHFEDRAPVQAFGPREQAIHALDPRHPVTIGPYMNDPDLLNNKYQLTMGMEAAHRVYPEIMEEWAKITGRRYPVLETYLMDDAEVAVFLANSAADTAKDVADALRAEGHKVGVISPNVLRPFPYREIREALKNVKAITIGERADSYGAHGGNLSHEIKSALKDDQDNRTICVTRIYGLGGKDFYFDDAREFFNLAIQARDLGYAPVSFDYLGANPGESGYVPPQVIAGLRPDEVNQGLTVATKNEVTGKVDVKVAAPNELVRRPKRVSQGHGTCTGCGIFPGIDQFLKGIEGDVVVLFQTGCAMVVTTGYPFTSHRVTYVHNLFQNGAATLSGLVEMYHERRRRGELPGGDDITFIMVSGDGGMDIGMGAALGTAARNHKLILLEYDNEGYMNTGAQQSYSTPLGHMTSTSGVGKGHPGKSFNHKDSPQIFVASGIPYVFTSYEGLQTDLVKKAAKAQWYATHEGMAYGKISITCPLNWRSEEKYGQVILKKAVDSCFFPLYEVEHGKTTITYDPEEKGKRIPISEWLGMMGKTKHLLKPENADVLKRVEEETELRWRRLKARHASELL